MLMVSLSLAVSVIPEGLPAIITITLAIGVQGLAKKNAIIRRLPAAETLGSVSVICTDKTGTLTKNEMTVKWVYTLKGEHQVTGEGYAPLGEILGAHSEELMEILKAGVLCNNAKLIQEGKSWKVLGDPTEACLLTSAKKAGLDTEKILKNWPRKEEWTFDSERKRMSTLHKDTLYVKGAPDSILEKCKMPEAMKKKILAQNAVYAQQAHRVLAFAKKTIKKGDEACEEDPNF
jgi:Ca2+-transporting ATPase